MPKTTPAPVSTRPKFSTVRALLIPGHAETPIRPLDLDVPPCVDTLGPFLSVAAGVLGFGVEGLEWCHGPEAAFVFPDRRLSANMAANPRASLLADVSGAPNDGMLRGGVVVVGLRRDGSASNGARYPHGRMVGVADVPSDLADLLAEDLADLASTLGAMNLGKVDAHHQPPPGSVRSRLHRETCRAREADRRAVVLGTGPGAGGGPDDLVAVGPGSCVLVACAGRPFLDVDITTADAGGPRSRCWVRVPAAGRDAVLRKLASMGRTVTLVPFGV